MGTDARGHDDLGAGPSLAAFQRLSLSINDPICVANATARAAKIVELAGLAVPIVPSVAVPLWFWRADAADGLQLESTVDGTNFRTYPGLATGGAWTSYTPTLAGTVSNPNLGTTGSIVAFYQNIGGTTLWEATLTAGGTGVAAGSGGYSLTLPPVTPAASGFHVVASGWIYGAAGFCCFVCDSAGAAAMRFIRTADGGFVDHTKGFDTAGKVMTLSGTIRTA